jgi:hypothetical protein
MGAALAAGADACLAKEDEEEEDEEDEAFSGESVRSIVSGAGRFFARCAPAAAGGGGLLSTMMTSLPWLPYAPSCRQDGGHERGEDAAIAAAHKRAADKRRNMCTAPTTDRP